MLRMGVSVLVTPAACGNPYSVSCVISVEDRIQNVSLIYLALAFPSFR